LPTIAGKIHSQNPWHKQSISELAKELIACAMGFEKLPKRLLRLASDKYG